jgi:hypothetical protein
MPLINFVMDPSTGPVELLRRLDPDRDVAEIVRGVRGWCLQTFLILRQRGVLEVECSERCDPDAINIVHAVQLPRINTTANTFVASIQADYPRRPMAQAHIVQNQSQVRRNSHFMFYWVQPGLVPRDVRREGVVTVGYAGQVHRNLAGNVKRWRDISHTSDGPMF